MAVKTLSFWGSDEFFDHTRSCCYGSQNAGVFLEIGSDEYIDHTACCRRHHGDVAGRGWNAHQNRHQGGHDQRKQQRERLSGYAKAQAERGRNPADYC